MALAEDAARDADRVGLFLRALDLEGSPQRPLSLAGPFLLDLGAALRLLDWERRGLRVHLEAGLPPAPQALRDTFAAVGPTAGASVPPPGTLARRVLTLFIERFAWAAHKELGAEVTLDQAQEDQVLEALADYLWEHRPR